MCVPAASIHSWQDKQILSKKTTKAYVKKSIFRNKV